MLSPVEIRARLQHIFPPGLENRGHLTKEITARLVFTCLYAGAIEGTGRWVRPNQVCRMTSIQSKLCLPADRDAWFVASSKNGFMPSKGACWYADNTRESVRDESLGEGLLPVGAAIERLNLPTTSGKGRYALAKDFAALFSSELPKEDLDASIKDWQAARLSKAALARTRLMSKGRLSTKDSLKVEFPNGEARLMAPGLSSEISKAVIEQFARFHLVNPQVLWLSESRTKVTARDEELAAQLGLVIDASKALPDIILVDLGLKPDGSDFKVVFVEVVATCGAVNTTRKNALLQIGLGAGFDASQLYFLSAFADREAAVFKKSLAELASGTLAWTCSEPRELVYFGQSLSLSNLNLQSESLT